MSAESQSERIWQYAMRPASLIGDVRPAPLNAANDDTSGRGSGGGGGGAMTTADFTEGFDSIPSQLHFHGLAPSQSQGTWPMSERSAPPPPVDGTESQKENLRLGIPSGSQSSIPPAPPSNPTFLSADTWKKRLGGKDPSSHVTEHVTSASPARANATLPPMNSNNGPISFSSGSAPLINKERDAALRATPLKLNNKAVSFRSPTAPPAPSPPTRTKTMPPRLNRYAPRDVNPSSQDSFAGPPVPQDLNEFARSSLILSNTFIRTNASGGVEAVYHRPQQFSSNSSSEPVGAMSVSQSEHTPEQRTASQVIRAAFDPDLSPPRPEPVVLAKDSQSQMQSQSDQQSQHSIHSLDAFDASSVSASFHLPASDPGLIATQPNEDLPQEQDVQLTQQNTQHAPVLPSFDATNPGSGPSPLPVPPHRRQQFAALEAQRLRARDEVVPETPLSTVAQSVAPRPARQDESSSNNEAARVETHVSKPRSTRARGKQSSPVAKAHATRPVSVGMGAAETEASVPLGMRAALQSDPEPHKPTTNAAYPGGEIVPDSQEEEQQQQPQTTQKHPHESEIVPDSQEEVQANLTTAAPSSPEFPLIDLQSRRKQREESPTPTPAAVRSPLRKGLLPEGITHTRGRSGDYKGKGKEKAAASMRGDGGSNSTQEDAEPMEVDKEQPVDIPPPSQASRTKHTSSRSANKKKPSTSTSRKGTKKRDAKASAAAKTPTPGPSTRSKKREPHTSGPDYDDGKTRTSSVPPAKRRRKTKPATPTPDKSAMTMTRVFARRDDKEGHYLPGTVTEMGSTKSFRASSYFHVRFDDGIEVDLDIKFMRKFELVAGDVIHVKWPKLHKNCEARVLSSERWIDELVEVQELGSGVDGDDFEVQSKYISISEEHIRSKFAERRVNFRILRGDEDSDVPFPIPPANQRLAGMGFVITLSELPRGKESLQSLITTSGGVVYEEWNSLLTIGGKSEANGRRMLGFKEDVAMKEGLPNLLFCLTSEDRTTPKYLIALALGVPCLSFRWVLDRVKQSDDELRVDWPAYVLPAGINPVTHLSASQSFDREWWRKGGDVSKLISDPPVFKPFLDKKFLCFGNRDFCFDENELGIFPKLLLAMGASYVEAVTDFRVLKKPAAVFDYTVVDDGEKHPEHQSAQTVDIYWIKKCLLTGVEGPVPWPDPS